MKFLQMLRQFRISSILDILWPSPDFWWPTDLDDDVQPGLLDKPKAAPLTVLEVQAAADVVQRLSDLYDYDDIEHVGWSADELRDAAEQMAQ
jgi:hypothetical protein